jgi:hypothetical protein
MDKCSICGKEIVQDLESIGTGYAETEDGQKVCYACCAVKDQAYMKEHGKIDLYLVLHPDQTAVINWPGTLRFPVRWKHEGRHNIAGKRTDAWFNGPDGYLWHGVTVGDNTQIIHCKRTKESIFAEMRP